jgi:hypothetical protein
MSRLLQHGVQPAFGETLLFPVWYEYRRFCFQLCKLPSATPESLHCLTLPPGKIISGKTAVALPTDKNRR